MARKSAKKKEPTSTDSVYTNPPRKQVLLLSCMDIRFLDDIVRFMNSMNLQNRYDHLILAGASMGANHLKSSQGSQSAVSWKYVFFDQLDAAINTLGREINDIFLLEHLDCGAYRELHPDQQVKDDNKKWANIRAIINHHRKEAHDFAAMVMAHCAEQYKKTSNENWKKIRVWPLLMNLVGDVGDL
jgi:carbonic anhydrase